MAICKSATRYDNDSYYETIVDEETEDVTVRGTNNGEPVEYALGSGGGDNMLVATIRMDYSGSQTPDNSIDKTFNEIKSAMQNGVPVYGKLVTAQNDVVISMTNIDAVSLNLLSQYGMSDFILFQVVDYSVDSSDNTKIKGLTRTHFKLLSDNTLTMEVATVQFTGA